MDCLSFQHNNKMLKNGGSLDTAGTLPFVLTLFLAVSVANDCCQRKRLDGRTYTYKVIVNLISPFFSRMKE